MAKANEGENLNPWLFSPSLALVIGYWLARKCKLYVNKFHGTCEILHLRDENITVSLNQMVPSSLSWLNTVKLLTSLFVISPVCYWPIYFKFT